MTVLANKSITDAARRNADVYLDELTLRAEELIGRTDPEDKARQATVASLATSIMIERLVARFGALPGWSGFGQGIGSAFAQTASETDRTATMVVLEESIALGYRDAVAIMAPVSSLRS